MTITATISDRTPAAGDWNGVHEDTARLLSAGLIKASDDLGPGSHWIKLDLEDGRTALVIVQVPR
jgi:hypothetical protein